MCRKLWRSGSFYRIIARRAAVLAVGIGATAIGVQPVSGQVMQSETPNVELLAVARIGVFAALAGAQLEYEAGGNIIPWVSARYGAQTLCDEQDPDGTCEGFASVAGLRYRIAAWGAFEPYLTAGAGAILWNNGGSALAVSGHAGALWTRFGRFRPRVEFGIERYSFGFNFGVGVLM